MNAEVIRSILCILFERIVQRTIMLIQRNEEKVVVRSESVNVLDLWRAEHRQKKIILRNSILFIW